MKRWILVGIILAVLLGAFVAEGLLKEEVCIAGQITDGVSTTFYDQVCS